MKVLPVAILSGLFCGTLGLFSAIWAVLFIVRGDIVDAVVALAVSMFCIGLVIPFFKLIPGKITPRVECDDDGTTFRPDRGMDIPVYVSLSGLVVASALLAVLLPLGKLDIPVPPAMRLSLPLGSAVIVAMGAPMLWRNLRRGSSKYLRLTPGGFEIAQGWRPQSGDWEQVGDVTDEAPGQTSPTPGMIVVVMADGSTATMAAASCTPEGAALRQLVRFYWEHEECRDELTDGRAFERLAEFECKP